MHFGRVARDRTPPYEVDRFRNNSRVGAMVVSSPPLSGLFHKFVWGFREPKDARKGQEYQRIEPCTDLWNRPLRKGGAGGVAPEFSSRIPVAPRSPSPRHVRTHLLHPLANSPRNRLPDTFQVLIQVTVQEPQHTDPERFNKHLPTTILLVPIADVVRFAVELDSQKQFGTVEVEPVGADAELTAKLATPASSGP